MTRRSIATQRIKIMPCSSCGADMEVGSNKRKAPRCIECGIKALIEHNGQMAARNGPRYEEWQAAMVRYAALLSRGTGDPM